MEEETSDSLDADEQQTAKERSIDRQVIYKQLAHIYTYPNIDLINYFLSEDVEKHLECYRHIGIEPDENIKKIVSWINEHSDKQTALRELEIEYTRLFVNSIPKIPAPPYGSVYLDEKGLVWGDSTADAYKLYVDAGLIISEDFHNIPDHIAAELEFVWYILKEELKAKEEKDNERFLKMSSIQYRFLTNHLLKWAPSFLSRVIESTRCTFYREVSALTKKFVEMERKQVLL